MWCHLRGWPKDAQRSIYQPVILAAFIMTVISLTVAGQITAPLLTVYAYGLVPLAAGLWIGLHLYGRLNEATFRKIILILLLFSGVALILPFK